MLTLREIDLGGVVIAGLVAGYVMAMAGLWASRVPGLVAIDIADFGRRYMISDRPSAWLLGLGSHLANSIILTLAFAMVIKPWLHFAGWLEGLLWGEALGLVLSGTLVAPMAGLGVLGVKTRDPRFAVTSMVLHGLWGTIVGFLYVP
jgi:hypothetical protein